jgi:hypothetical protein
VLRGLYEPIAKSACAAVSSRRRITDHGVSRSDKLTTAAIGRACRCDRDRSNTLYGEPRHNRSGRPMTAIVISLTDATACLPDPGNRTEELSFSGPFAISSSNIPGGLLRRRM